MVLTVKVPDAQLSPVTAVHEYVALALPSLTKCGHVRSVTAMMHTNACTVA
jgi:hypothetical protein